MADRSPLPLLTNRNSRTRELLLSLPSLAWLTAFLLVPTLMVFAIAFRPADLYGGIGEGWTLETLHRMASPNYPTIIWRTIWLSVASTALCLFLSIPVSYFLARISARWRQWIMLGVVVPFWTNFLIRVFAGKLSSTPTAPSRASWSGSAFSRRTSPCSTPRGPFSW